MSKSSIILPNNISSDSNITLDFRSMGRKIADAIYDLGKLMFDMADKKLIEAKCHKCGRKDRLKVIPIYTDPYPIPSEMILYCKACHANKSLFSRERDKKLSYKFEEILKMVKGADSEEKFLIK